MVKYFCDKSDHDAAPGQYISDGEYFSDVGLRSKITISDGGQADDADVKCARSTHRLEPGVKKCIGEDDKEGKTE